MDGLAAGELPARGRRRAPGYTRGGSGANAASGAAACVRAVWGMARLRWCRMSGAGSSALYGSPSRDFGRPRPHGLAPIISGLAGTISALPTRTDRTGAAASDIEHDPMRRSARVTRYERARRLRAGSRATTHRVERAATRRPGRHDRPASARSRRERRLRRIGQVGGQVGSVGVARRGFEAFNVAARNEGGVPMKTILASLAVVAVLATHMAHAGALAPAPRIIAKFERDFIERSGAQTLEELLDTGIVRYFLTGGQSLLVLVNGRPYATTSSDLDTLPLSAIERIELLGSESLGTLGGSAVRGALNVVLRSDLDGVEARAITRMPSRDGGDGQQGSVFWGGAVGEGRMTVGVDVLRREEITARSREYSRSEWPEGGRVQRGEERQCRREHRLGRAARRRRRQDRREIGRAGRVRPGGGLYRPVAQSARHHLGRQGLRFRLRGHHVEHRQLRAAERDPEPGPPAHRRRPPVPGRECHAGRFGVPLRAVGRLVRLHAGHGPAAGNQRRGRLGLRGGRQRLVRRGAPIRAPRQPGLADGHRGSRRLRGRRGPDHGGPRL